MSYQQPPADRRYHHGATHHSAMPPMLSSQTHQPHHYQTLPLQQQQHHATQMENYHHNMLPALQMSQAQPVQQAQPINQLQQPSHVPAHMGHPSPLPQNRKRKSAMDPGPTSLVQDGMSSSMTNMNDYTDSTSQYRQPSMGITSTAVQERPPSPVPVAPPTPKKTRTNTPWSVVEEKRLKAMRDKGDSWADIAKAFPHRTEGSVKKHWYKDMHYADFAPDEADALLAAIKDYEQNRWKIIGQKVGKPPKACEQFAKEHLQGKW